jgi:nitrate reductase gamma subunit
MTSPWTNLYDRFKDRRYAAFFLCVLLSFLGSLVLGPVLIEGLLREVDPKVLLWIGTAFGALTSIGFFLIVRRLVARRNRRTRFPPLSSDELRAARSKLVKTRDRKGV